MSRLDGSGHFWVKVRTMLWLAAVACLLHCSATAAARAAACADLRPEFRRLGLATKAQGRRNTCSVCTMTAAMEFALSKKLNRGASLSAEYLNWACNQVIGNRTEDRGQFFRDLEQGFNRWGTCAESLMPYAPAFAPDYSPSRQALQSAQWVRAEGLQFRWIKPNDGKVGVTHAHLEQTKQALRAGWPVCAGASHSVLVVGFLDDPSLPGGGRFYTRDSGSGSEGSLTYADALARLCDILWVEAPTGPR